MTKICARCGEEKDVRQFRPRKDSRDGLRNECKQCYKKSYNHGSYAKKYCDTHKEQVSERRRKYYELHYQHKGFHTVFKTDDDGDILKRCCKCGQWFTVDNYYSCRGQTHGIASMCKECGKKKSKDFRNKNREYFKEYSKRYSAPPKTKARRYFKGKGIIKPTNEMLGLKTAHIELGTWIRELEAEYRKDPVIFYKGEEKVLKMSHEWYKLRVDILLRDNKRCVLCGRGAEDGVILNVDHIIPVSNNWEKRFDPDNLQTLCEECNQGKADRYSESWRGGGLDSLQPPAFDRMGKANFCSSKMGKGG
jgi:hypothetical protein